MLAASYANADITKILIENGANINQTRGKGYFIVLIILMKSACDGK